MTTATETKLSEIERFVLLSIFSIYEAIQLSFEQQPETRADSAPHSGRESMRYELRKNDCVKVDVKNWFLLDGHDGIIGQRVKRAIDKLEELAFVERVYSGHGYRARHVRLLPAGREYVSTIRADIEKLNLPIVTVYPNSIHWTMRQVAEDS